MTRSTAIAPVTATIAASSDQEKRRKLAKKTPRYSSDPTEARPTHTARRLEPCDFALRKNVRPKDSGMLASVLVQGSTKAKAPESRTAVLLDHRDPGTTV